MNNLWNIGWGTVSSCNMNCEFCYSRSRRAADTDLKFDDWISFVDNNWKYINSLNYGTGENSLSDDWFRLIKHIRENYPGIRQALTTNGYVGYIIDKDETKRKIIMDAIDEMDISVDYADPEKHTRFRGQPKAYDWALETLDFCQKNDKPATIVCLGSAVNAYPENLAGIFEIAKQYGAILRMNLYRPTDGIDEFSKRFILEPDALVDLLRWIGREHTILSISDALYSSLLTDRFEKDPSGFDSLRVLPNGDVSPSTYLIKKEYIVGNIKEKNILERLMNDDFLHSIIEEVIPEECAGCRYADSCKGGVYDRRYLWKGTLNRKDPYCTYTPGDPEWEKLPVSDAPFHSVHHGYLPTMFFKPGKES